MKRPTLPDRAHLVHAVAVDLDDPFLSRRLRSARSADFSGTRRIPAPIEERFTLITVKRKTR